MNLLDLVKHRISATPSEPKDSTPQETCTALVKASQALCKPGAAALPSADRAVQFMALPVEYRTLAIQRRDFVREVVNVKIIGKTVDGKYKPLSEKDALAAVLAANPGRWPELRKNGQHGESSLNYANFRRWLAALCDKDGKPDWENLYALRDKYIGHGREAQAETEQGKKFMQLVASYYEKEKGPALKEAHRLALISARNLGLPQDACLSYNQICYHYANKVERASLLAARNGKEWAQNRLMGYITRSWDSVPIGSCWVGDHHIMDFAVRVWDETLKRWKAVRPWLTIWLDARSLYVIGWIIRVDEHPDSRAIEEALLNGIRMNGNQPPEILYTDNGKDYLSAGLCEVFTTSDGVEHSIGKELSTIHMKALPYRGRSKTAERFFREVATRFAKLFKSYLGCNPKDRPEAAIEEWNNPEELVSERQANEAFAWWLENQWHAQGAYSSDITGGRSPQEIWDSRRPFRQALTDAQLYMAMLKPVGERVVDRGGRVSVDRISYQSGALWPYITRKILIKADRANPLHVWAFKSSGELLCEVPAVQSLPAVGADRDALSKALAEQRRLLKHTRELHLERIGGKARLAAPVSRLEIAQGDAPDVEDVPERPEPEKTEAPPKPMSDANLAADIALLEELKHKPEETTNSSAEDDLKLLEELKRKEENGYE
jgi:hypothetical protein